MTSTQLTVVTIGRNALDELRLTRTSVAAQSYANIRHLLIDGASTDGTGQYLAELEFNEMLHWVSEPDTGIYDAMNKALEHVDGGYLMYLHAGDSFVDNDAVQRVMSAIGEEAASPDLVIGWSRFVSGGQALPYVVGGPTPQALTSAHESTIFSHEFHKHERYNTELQLGADYEFFRQLAAREELNVLRVPFTISNFAFGGRSNDPAYDGARFLERARIDAGFGEQPTALSYLRIAGRMATRQAVYKTLGDDGAAKFFLKLACRRGNSGARPLPVDQFRVG